MAMTNSTGCSSVWGRTYPYNPYPFPWVNHLFQDAPSIAIGIFEGHMRKMGDNFMTVRKAELLFNDEYDEAEYNQAFVEFDWQKFSDEEHGAILRGVSRGKHLRPCHEVQHAEPQLSPRDRTVGLGQDDVEELLAGLRVLGAVVLQDLCERTDRGHRSAPSRTDR